MIRSIFVTLIAISDLALCALNRSTISSHRRGQHFTIDDVSKISGGRDVREGEFPFMVHLYIAPDEIDPDDSTLEFGGAIISDTRVLTACHCLAHPLQAVADNCIAVRNPTNSYVTAGSRERNELKRTQKRFAATFQIHQKCTANELALVIYDLGIITVTQKFKFNIDVQPAKVYTKSPKKYKKQMQDIINRGALCEFPGWGLDIDESGGKPSSILQMANTRLMTNEDCESQTCHQLADKTKDVKVDCPFKAVDTLYCGRFQNDACYGDSGGPLICEGHLVGLVSSAGLCLADRPTFFISIEDVLGYIDEEPLDLDGSLRGSHRSSRVNSRDRVLSNRFLFLLISAGFSVK